MNVRTMRLSSRLLLAFGVMLMLFLVSSGVALWKLSDMHSGLTRIVTVSNVKTSLAERMAQSVHIVSRVERTLALLTDESEKRIQRKKIDVARAEYAQARTELDKFPAGSAGASRRAAIDALRAECEPLTDKVIELGLSNDAKDATSFLMARAAPATQRWQDALDDYMAFQTQGTVEQYEAAKTDYTEARNVLIGCALLSTLVAVTLALLIVRSIVSELGGEPAEVAAIAHSIADADLSMPIQTREVDTSSVMAAMARMQQALRGVVSEVRGNAESVATASAQIAQGNLDLSQRTEKQASTLQQTAATMVADISAKSR